MSSSVSPECPGWGLGKITRRQALMCGSFAGASASEAIVVRTKGCLHDLSLSGNVQTRRFEVGS